MSLTQTIPTFNFNKSFAKFTFEDPRLYSSKNSRKVSNESCDTATTTDSITDASFKESFSPSSDSPRNNFDLRASFGSIDDESNVILNSAMKPKKKVATDETKYKTELCKKYAETGLCPYGKKCKFAHGKHELNEKALANKRRYKSKKCNSFHNNMNCPYGSRCLFAHEQRTVEELQVNNNCYEKFLLFPELLNNAFSNKKQRLPSFMSAIDTEIKPQRSLSTKKMIEEVDEEFNYIFKITSQ